MIDESPQRRVRAVRLEKEGATLIYDETWTEQDNSARIEKLLKTVGAEVK